LSEEIKMPTFIFEVSEAKKDAMVCEQAFKKLHAKFKTGNDDPTYREGKDGVFRLNPDKTETKFGDTEIWIDPALGFGVEDIPDDWSFGNGTTVGSIILKDEREIVCAWIVVPNEITDMIKADIDKIRKIFV